MKNNATKRNRIPTNTNPLPYFSSISIEPVSINEFSRFIFACFIRLKKLVSISNSSFFSFMKSDYSACNKYFPKNDTPHRCAVLCSTLLSFTLQHCTVLCSVKISRNVGSGFPLPESKQRRFSTMSYGTFFNNL